MSLHAPKEDVRVPGTIIRGMDGHLLPNPCIEGRTYVFSPPVGDYIRIHREGAWKVPESFQKPLGICLPPWHYRLFAPKQPEKNEKPRVTPVKSSYIGKAKKPLTTTMTFEREKGSAYQKESRTPRKSNFNIGTTTSYHSDDFKSKNNISDKITSSGTTTATGTQFSHHKNFDLVRLK